jgi:hypothetical protein
MRKDSSEQNTNQLRQELSQCRQLLAERDTNLKEVSEERDQLKSKCQGYSKEIEELRNEVEALRIQLKLALSSGNKSSSKNPLELAEGNQLREVEFAEGVERIRGVVEQKAGMGSGLPTESPNHPNGQSNTNGANQRVSRLKLADRVNHSKFKINLNDSRKKSNEIFVEPLHSVNRKPNSTAPINARIMKTFTPQVQRRFFMHRSTNQEIDELEPRRSETFNFRANPNLFASDLDYNEYLSKVTHKDKADKIKMLIDLCNRTDKTPCVKNVPESIQTQKTKRIPSAHKIPGPLSSFSPNVRTLLAHSQFFFQEEIKNTKASGLVNEVQINMETNELERKTSTNINTEAQALPQSILESVEEEERSERLADKKADRKGSLPFSLEWKSKSDHDGHLPVDEPPIANEISPTKSCKPSTSELHKIYEDFLIVGCHKDKLGTYIAENDISFSVLFDLYALDSSDPNNQNDDLVKFMIPFSQKIRTVKIKNTIGKINEILFQDEATCKNFEFFCISLNSSIASQGQGQNQRPAEEFFRGGDLGILKETNPNLCFYYYCAKVDDFFVDAQHSQHFTSDLIEFSFFPKYFVIKTLYPMSQFFFNVLQQVLSISKRNRIEKLLDSLKGGKIDIETLEKIDSRGMAEAEISAIIPLFERLDEISMYNNFDEQIRIDVQNVSISYAIPSLKSCSFVEAEFGFSKVLSQFAFEEFLFILFAIMSEHSVVFVSEDMSNLTACISTFISLIKPFKWPFPIIYSLPEDCLVMLGSPIPLLVGINLPADTVISDILPEHESKSRADSSTNIYVFVDHNLFFYDFETLDSLLIPQYDDFSEKLEKLYKKSFNPKSSNFFKLNKRKKGKAAFTYVQQTNTSKMKEQLVRLDRMSVVKNPDKSAIDRFKLPNLTKHYEYYSIFNYFKNFFESFIIAKLPIDKNISEFGRETKVEEIDVGSFSGNPADIEFLEGFMRTQCFVYFLENDFESILLFRKLNNSC